MCGDVTEMVFGICWSGFIHCSVRDVVMFSVFMLITLLVSTHVPNALSRLISLEILRESKGTTVLSHLLGNSLNWELATKSLANTFHSLNWEFT